MKTQTQFETLFVISVAHAYYTRDCEDIAFLVPTATQAVLNNGKLLTREIDGRLHVLFEADEQRQPLRSIAGTSLRLGLRLTNPFFSNFTNVDESFASSTLLYRNATTATALDAPSRVQLVGGVFDVSLSKNARPATVRLKDADGVVLETNTITAAANHPSVSYDLSRRSPNAYTIEEEYPTSTVQNVYYSDAELASAGVFGIVEITIPLEFYSAPVNFEIPFEAREERLKYYVVARNLPDADVDALTIADSGFAEDERSKINFVRVPPSSFTEAEIPADLLAGDSGRVVLFKSQSDVARSQKPPKKIQLKKGSDVLITHLPQPGPDKTTADLIVAISKP